MKSVIGGSKVIGERFVRGDAWKANPFQGYYKSGTGCKHQGQTYLCLSEDPETRCPFEDCQCTNYTSLQLIGVAKA